ncbi:MAG TPA: hypothetical protein VM534_09135 [Thermoanaerobaculia bacterium]|nr:hypothetical protein [Thermoanaerobaculia bacterium]
MNRKWVVAVLLVLMSTAAFASNFRAADLIYLPAVGRFTSGDVVFKSNVFINNVSDVPIVVTSVLADSNVDNRGVIDNPAKVMDLAVIQPGDGLFFDDFVQEVYGLSTFFGQVLFFGCAQGGDCTQEGVCPSDDPNCDPCSEPGEDCEPFTVQSRIYADQATSKCFGQAGCTTGQLFTGLPWYSYISPDVADRDLDEVIITGIQEFGTRNVNGFRSNVGFTNSSQYSSITLRITLFREDGTQFGTTTLGLFPLSHTQGNIASLFPGFTGSGFVTVRTESFTPTDPGNSDPFIASGLPGFYAYGSVADNVTNDATTLEAMYLVEFDFASVYGKNFWPATPKRAVRRGSR